uniref:Transmembrane protein n=1 Tax=Trypanosoma vivax (strain Y486) TaxID=1055687 RepID=G0TXU7_TRYVY|nr:conserved hypothetical protein [Trypanosoma vivax Y486]
MRRICAVPLPHIFIGACALPAPLRYARYSDGDKGIATSKPVKAFSSHTRFKLHSHQVNETNAPSAWEVAMALATRAEIEEMLPSARELESRYAKQPTQGAHASCTGVPSPEEAGGTCATTAPESALWPDSDTLEDIMDEERYGSALACDEVPPPSPEHILLAWRALLWGTAWAVVGVGAVVVLAMFYCGVDGPSSVTKHLRGHSERELRRLMAEKGEVERFVLDLTNPSALGKQVQDIWRAVERATRSESESVELHNVNKPDKNLGKTS